MKKIVLYIGVLMMFFYLTSCKSFLDVMSGIAEIGNSQPSSTEQSTPYTEDQPQGTQPKSTVKKKVTGEYQCACAKMGNKIPGQCVQCRGTGYGVKYIPGTKTKRKCQYCHGTGKCRNCKGTGKISTSVWVNE